MNTYVVRYEATLAQRRALKALAAENGLTLTQLCTMALQTSPHTKKAFA